MSKKMEFAGETWLVKKAYYMDKDNLAVILVDEEESYVGTYATVNTHEDLPKNEAYVKDYSENEGMLDALKEAGLVHKITGGKPSGFVYLPRVMFNLEDVELFEG